MLLKEATDRKFRLYILIFILTELISFSGYFWPVLNLIGFAGILIFVFLISLRRLDYGLYIILAELFVGSKGYLFSIGSNNFVVSLRIGLWLVILIAWFVRKIYIIFKDHQRPQIIFFQSELFYLFSAFGIFLTLGVINGFISRNGLVNIYSDFNNWLFLLLLLPFYDAFFGQSDPGQKITELIRVFLAALTWLSLKTVILLYIFSHNITGIVYDLYRWVRLTGIGEITLIQGGFYRIFFQSHIYILPAVFLLLIFIGLAINNFQREKRQLFILLLLLILFLSATMLSFSRSNWLGFLIGLVLYFLIILFQRQWRAGLITLSVFVGSILLAGLLVATVVKFPVPNPTGGFDTASLFVDRASQLIDEAGVASRWELLPKLWQAVKKKPIIGSGFGKTVTYISHDPRVLENNRNGQYTTYAFEWGYLDIWLKLGLIGVLLYLYILAKIVIMNLKNTNKPQDAFCLMRYALVIGLISIAVVNIFSPYLNHPLGLGYVIFILVLSDKLLLNTSSVNPLAEDSKL